jgi:hypothetical protein
LEEYKNYENNKVEYSFELAAAQAKWRNDFPNRKALAEQKRREEEEAQQEQERQRIERENIIATQQSKLASSIDMFYREPVEFRNAFKQNMELFTNPQTLMAIGSFASLPEEHRRVFVENQDFFTGENMIVLTKLFSLNPEER